MKLSISEIKAYKACRQLWRLRYVEKLRPVKTAEPLMVGTTYHAMVESLERGEELPKESTRERAMAEAFRLYILPHLPSQIETEKWLEMDIGDDDKLVGIADGVCEGGSIIEHKTTSATITEAYEYGLQWDEQILAYMLLTGGRDAYYTICQKPTIRQKKGESDEEYYQRCIEWYEGGSKAKIRLLRLFRDETDINTFLKQLMYLKTEIRAFKDLYKVYGESACIKWGRRCEYSSICLNYNSNAEYIEFTRE